MENKERSVLILDDDRIVRKSLEAYFQDREWTVISAETAEEALEILKTRTPQCAIVDIRLPGMSGNAFLLRLKDEHPNLACVICTGSPQYDQPVEFASVTQVSRLVFQKPVTDLEALENELLEQIRKCSKI